MKSVSLALAHANQEDVNAPISPRDARTPLHLATSLGSLPIVQLLIWVSSPAPAWPWNSICNPPLPNFLVQRECEERRSRWPHLHFLRAELLERGCRWRRRRRRQRQQHQPGARRAPVEQRVPGRGPDGHSAATASTEKQSHPRRQDHFVCSMISMEERHS